LMANKSLQVTFVPLLPGVGPKQLIVIADKSSKIASQK